jgi:polyphosphate:AMP phosphotransferase
MFESAEVGEKLDKKTFDARAPRVRSALLDAQARLSDSNAAVIIVIAGAEGAGKGETVNFLLNWLDVRQVETHALGPPTQEETERPGPYRFWRRLPPKGKIAVFFGSWYTQPIIDRIEKTSSEAQFDRAMHQIVEFERMLSREGIVLMKFWFHITRKQQARNFRKLERDPDTAWRVTKRDWQLHKSYDRYIEVSARALRQTSSGHAAWNIIEATDHRYRHMTVAERLIEAINERLEVAEPAPPPEPALPVPPRKNIINSLDLSHSLTRKEYRRDLAKLQGKLGRLSREMTRAGCSAVLVFEGSDAAGKGGCIRRVVQALDARFYRAIPISAPTDEELARPYLWRFWRTLPRRGHIGIYDRSWYGRVLVERIEGICRPQDWQRAYAEINSFEEGLVDFGVLVLKFWLAISKDVQLERFQQRRATGYKRYKITPEDWRNREKWDAYEAAACDVIEQTSTDIAPWYLVEANDKRFARIKVLKTICDRLQKAME